MVLNSKYKNEKVYKVISLYYGLNKPTGLKVLSLFGVSKVTEVRELPRWLLAQINRYVINNYKINDELRNELLSQVRDEYAIKSYKGYRRRLKLPLNGQRSKTNRKTVKKLL